MKHNGDINLNGNDINNCGNIDAPIGNLNNVDETGKVNGDALVYNSTSGNWEPATVATSVALDDLTDVTETTPQSAGDVLVYDGGWVTRIPQATEIHMSSVDTTTVSTKIIGNEVDIATNASDILAAAALISANTAAISANDGDIANNANDISTLEGTVVAHVASVETHTDVNVTSKADEDMLQWDAGTSKWVNVPTPPTITINNNGAFNVVTGGGTTNSLTGQDKLQWEGTGGILKVLATNFSAGVEIDGGVYPATSPSIGVGAGWTRLDAVDQFNMKDDTKLTFNESTNDYIASDLSGNLRISATNDVDIYSAAGFRVWDDATTPRVLMDVTHSGTNPRVAIGSPATTSNAELKVDGKVEADFYNYDFIGEEIAFQGETINLGSDAVTAGKIYYWDGTNWQGADADVEAAAQSLLAVATTSNSNKGMLVCGWVKHAATVTNGQLYMSATANEFTTTPPSTSGQFVRVVGHGINSTTWRFNPSNDYFEVE